MRVKDVGIAENFLKRDGRLNRWRYFKRVFVLGFAEMLLLTAAVAATADENGALSTVGIVLYKGIGLASLVPFFCLAVRRLHDVNRDETLAYILFALNVAISLFFDDDFSVTEPSFMESLLAAAATLIGLYMLLCPGTAGDNQYGTDPLEE